MPAEMTRRTLLQAMGGLLASMGLTKEKLVESYVHSKPMDLTKSKVERVVRQSSPLPHLPPGLHRHLTLQVYPSALQSEVTDDRGSKLGLIQGVRLLPEVALLAARMATRKVELDEGFTVRRQLVELDLVVPSQKPRVFTGGKLDGWCMLKPKILPGREPEYSDILAVVNEFGGFPDLAFVEGLYDPNSGIIWATVKGWATVYFHPGIIPGMYQCRSGDTTWSRVEHNLDELKALQPFGGRQLTTLQYDPELHRQVEANA